MQEGETADTSRQSSCAACSILSVLTQWGATLVIKLKGGGARSRGQSMTLLPGETEQVFGGLRARRGEPPLRGDDLDRGSTGHPEHLGVHSSSAVAGCVAE